MSNQVTGPGGLYDVDGSLIAAGANMPVGAAIGRVLTSDASGGVAWQPGLSLAATTGTAGYTLVNGTGNIITWAVPNDGALHTVMIVATMNVTVNETGGQLAVSFTAPDGATFLSSFFAAGLTTGVKTTSFFATVKAGTTVALTQNTALTAGTSTAWAQIWGS
jgi:hypothetical protein